MRMKMAEAHGGYRQPSSPAPVSGPGALSKRTDGGAIDGKQKPATQGAKYMPGLPYGQGGQNMTDQQSAPLAGNTIPSMPTPLVPLSAPSQRPNEPVTTGVDVGPGAGSEAMMPMAGVQRTPSQTMRRIAQFDPSGEAELHYLRLLENGN